VSTSLAHDLSPSRLALTQVDRALFALTVCVGCAIMWLAPRLPMTDLPQHAAQVALWRDLLSGASPWADLVRINLLTPYLIGYGLMLPLSFWLPLDVVARVVLDLALLGFVGGFVLLRRAFDGDRRLDWLSLFGFFGFAWQWGLLTFLVAAPLALLFLAIAQGQTGGPTRNGSLLLIGLGLLLLISHGLVFLMAVALGGLLTLWGLWRRRHARPIAALLPYTALGVACVGFRLATRHAEGAMQFDAWAYGLALPMRPLAGLVFVTGSGSAADPVLVGTVCLALAAPTILGLAFNRSGGAVLAAGTLMLFLGLPDYAFQTAFLFNRFALFLLPFYATMFRAGKPPGWRRELVGLVALAGASWLTLGIQAARIVAFARESQPFETVLAAAEPNHRAIALIYDKASAAAHNPQVYMHYAAWYQADKHGFIDFNFADFHPQIVRFRPGREPKVTLEISWQPELFDWVRQDGRVYDYFFVRGASDDVAALRRASPCALTTRAQDGPWFLLQRGACRTDPEPLP
jgi:hypothetical protein